MKHMCEIFILKSPETPKQIPKWRDTKRPELEDELEDELRPPKGPPLTFFWSNFLT